MIIPAIIFFCLIFLAKYLLRDKINIKTIDEKKSLKTEDKLYTEFTYSGGHNSVDHTVGAKISQNAPSSTLVECAQDSNLTVSGEKALSSKEFDSTKLYGKH